MKGMKIPEWTYTADESFCKDINVTTRIYSVSTPGVSHIQDPDEAAKLAREMNELCASLKSKNPTSCGFFATIPSPLHTEHALRELRYAFDHLDADGVTLFTSYGPLNNYLGHEGFVPLWEELDARKAVVFVHPCDNGPNASMFNDKVAGPTFDWPHETGRTAMDMIVNKRMQQFPNVKIILSHAGGTLPILIRRSTLLSMPEFGGVMSAEDMYESAKRFYFDTALAGSREVFPLIFGFAKRGHLLFGSDYPHATARTSKAHAEFIEQYPMDDESREEIYHGAALELFPRLRGAYEA
jgi:predicted TIM-barrel fold metal-dependent hydrolase